MVVNGVKNFWLKLAICVGVLSILTFDLVYFSDLEPGTKYKIYTLQFYTLFTTFILFISRYFWKCFVIELLEKVTSFWIKLIWKSLVFSFLFLAHIAQFTNQYGSTEPYTFQMAAWLCFGAYTILILILPTARFLHWLLLPKSHGRRGFLSQKAVTVACIFATLVVSFTSYFLAMEGPQIVKVTIPMKGMDKSLDGLKIALLTDVHIGPTVGLSSIKLLVDRTNSIEPDIIAVTGDLIDTKVRYGKNSALPLGELKSKFGKYFVTGNHEYYTGEVEQWMEVLSKLGFQNLHNSNVKIQPSPEGEWLCLMGTDDIQANKISYGEHGMNLTSAFEGCDNRHTNILLAHQPNAAKTAVDDQRYDISLVLSGHTHGGQLYSVAIPIYVTNAFYRGLYPLHQGRAHVYVSQGSFYWGMPMRWGTVCEITHITLRATV